MPGASALCDKAVSGLVALVYKEIAPTIDCLGLLSRPNGGRRQASRRESNVQSAWKQKRGAGVTLEASAYRIGKSSILNICSEGEGK